MRKSSLFVVNPIAGGNSKEPLLQKIKSWGQSSGCELKILETTGKNDGKRIKKAIDEYQPGQVIAAGGDGTVLLCAGLLKDTDIPLGIIPSGSANGMCAELEIPPRMDLALEIIEKGKSRKVDMLLFDNGQLALHISDIGLNARLVKNFEQSENRGFLGYAKGMIRELIDVEPFEVTLKTENEELTRLAYMVAFANARRYGTGALLNSAGKIDDGLFEICILKELNFAGIAGQFFDFINEDSEYMEVIQCKQVEVTTNRKVSFQMDGELQKDVDRIKTVLCPGCLRILVP